MNRPSLSNFVMGHWLGVTLTTSLALFTGAAWVIHDSIPWLIPGVALLLCKTSLKARGRVVAYRRWREAWNEMSGATPQRKATGKRTPGAWKAVGFAVWLALLCWLVPHQAENSTQAALFAIAWLLLSAWGAVRAVFVLLRWAFTRPTRAAGTPRLARQREHLVSICLPVPWSSPPLGRIRAALPDYCQALLARDRRAMNGNAPTDSVQRN